MRKPKKKVSVVGVRLSEGEYTALQWLSHDQDITYSDYLRGLLRADAEKRGLPQLGYVRNPQFTGGTNGQ